MSAAREGASVTLPWPPRELSPNARVHWAKRSKVAKAYRQRCGWLTKAAGLPVPDGVVHLWVMFCPPDRRRRDDDNAIAAFKAGRDGIADALGIDDSRFVLHPMLSETISGEVRVTITGGPDERGE